MTSGKGGVGKTTVVAELGRRLAEMGYKVVAVDGDVGLNNLDVVTAIDMRVVYDISDVVMGKCRPFQALVQDSQSSMRILPSSRDSTLLTAQAFGRVIDSLFEFDFVLIDCPAGIEQGFHRAVSCSNEAIVVTTPSISSIRDADKVIGLLSSYNMCDTALVVNRVRADMVAKGEMVGAKDVGALLHLPVIGVIPEDDMITTFQQLGSVPRGALSNKAYDLLASNVAKRSKIFCDIVYKRRWLKRR